MFFYRWFCHSFSLRSLYFSPKVSHKGKFADCLLLPSNIKNGIIPALISGAFGRKLLWDDSIIRRFESCYPCQNALKQPQTECYHLTNFNGFPEVSHSILSVDFFRIFLTAFFFTYSPSILAAAWTFNDSKT